jgi:hypothetical protein
MVIVLLLQLIIAFFLLYAIWVFVSSHRRVAVASEEIAASLRKKFEAEAEADRLADEAKIEARRRVDDAKAEADRLAELEVIAASVGKNL